MRTTVVVCCFLTSASCGSSAVQSPADARDDAVSCVDAAPGTPDALPAPDAAPVTPDAAPPTCAWVSLLTDGDFESVPVAGWTGNTWLITQYTTDPLSSHYSPVHPHGGLYELGLYRGGGVEQNISIPASATAIRLSGYRYQWSCSTGSGGEASIRLSLDSPEWHAPFLSLDFGYAGFESDPWTEFSVDGTGDFAGANTVFGIGASDLVCMAFDDLVLEAYVCS